jgi:hypothetical protein
LRAEQAEKDRLAKEEADAWRKNKIVARHNAKAAKTRKEQKVNFFIFFSL